MCHCNLILNELFAVLILVKPVGTNKCNKHNLSGFCN